jgi:hypothetical protein
VSVEVEIPLSQLQAHDLPGICVKSGRPATAWVACVFFTKPPSRALYLPFGVLAMRMGPTVKTHLPACRAIVWQRRVVGALVSLLAVAGVVLLFGAPIAGNITACWIAGAMVCAAGAIYAAVWPQTWVRGELRGGVVVVRGVDPSFAAATRYITQRGPLVAKPGLGDAHAG